MIKILNYFRLHSPFGTISELNYNLTASGLKIVNLNLIYNYSNDLFPNYAMI